MTTSLETKTNIQSWIETGIINPVENKKYIRITTYYYWKMRNSDVENEMIDCL